MMKQKKTAGNDIITAEMLMNIGGLKMVLKLKKYFTNISEQWKIDMILPIY